MNTLRAVVKKGIKYTLVVSTYQPSQVGTYEIKGSMDGEFDIRLMEQDCYQFDKTIEGEWTSDNNKGANEELEK